ncbi:DNA-processing protein DprA [Aquisalimonas sp.]|uniref:DNA-processing protein DprA n=1 Tax=Aquisalimonas sp. TaxID=1872621 RepID=UPI003456A3B3
MLTWTDTRYPALLREMDSPPLCLYVNGDPDVLNVPQLAIVGSRNATAGGRSTAREFAEHLASRGLTITSGLAVGVDAAAHQGALDGGGFTVAVTATGPDRVYPPRHRSLAHAIAADGAVVTEFPCGTPPRAGHFPRRNRIISGLAAGTLVVEASPRSGSLITARLALEQGREVFAIPGSIHNPLARGCHRLIRDGSAKLVEQADEILEELTGRLQLPREPATGTGNGTEPQQLQLDPEHEAVLNALGYDPVPLETVLQRTGLTPDVVSSILLLLELSGRITAMPGGRYARAGRDR